LNGLNESSGNITPGKKTHTIKAQLVADERTEEILKIDCAKGKVHDFELYKRSKLCLHPQTEALVDLGYKGILKLHSNGKIPFKSSKDHPLTKEQKRFNKQHSQRRIKIENIIRKCKIFQIVKQTYRGKHKNYGLVWNVVAALVNLKNSKIN
jgi:hypothetical protein